MGAWAVWFNNAPSAGWSDASSYCSQDEAAMIGAMPAVAVRHERRRQEKRNKRPSLLYLQSPHSRSATPSPLQSPPASHQHPPEIYVCGKISVLHVVVVSLLLGAVLLIVGLVQLKPGADASQHRYMLLGSGTFLLFIGVILAIVRCCLLPWKQRQLALDPEEPAVTVTATTTTTTTTTTTATTASGHHQESDRRRESFTQVKRDSIVRETTTGRNSLTTQEPAPPVKTHESGVSP